MKNQVPALDHEVFCQWDELIAQRNRAWPMSKDEYFEFLRAQESQWNQLLAMAFDGDRWLVQNQRATMVSISLWARAMALGNYAEAQACIERCLGHHDSFDEFDRTLLVVSLEAARIAQSRNDIELGVLLRLLTSKRKDRANNAMEVIHNLVQLAEELGEDMSAPKEISLLAEALADAKGFTSETVEMCGGIQTWGDMKQVVYRIAGWPLPKALLEADSEANH